MLALLLALQETSASATPSALLDIHFDLAKASPPAAPGDIVVVARRRDPRLPVLPDRPELHEGIFPKAETRLFGGTAAVVGETKELPGGVTSKRIMLRWKATF